MGKIVVTGATGFIGSNLLYGLERAGYTDIVAVDTFGCGEKWKNVAKRTMPVYISPEELMPYLHDNKYSIGDIVHLGAISSTTEKDVDAIIAANYSLTTELFRFCLENGISLIYASSAATYGNGENGFSDNEDLSYLSSLRPQNAYGWSKNLVDMYVAQNGGFNKKKSPSIVALKFFNVYGPNEYHKGSQKSVINTFYNQLITTGSMKLFRSNNPEIADGEQKRDFVSVDDCVNVILWFLSYYKQTRKGISGIYNVGTGVPATFNQVASFVAKAAGKECKIEYVDMPENVSAHYQNYTCADITKLRNSGYTFEMTSIEQGIKNYIENYLTKQDNFK